MANVQIVKCPSPKRNRVSSSLTNEMLAAMRTLKPGQAVQCPVHSTVACSAVSTINAYLGDQRFRAFKATDDKTYVTTV